MMREVLTPALRARAQGGSRAGARHLARPRPDRWRRRPARRRHGGSRPSSASTDVAVAAIAKGPDRNAGRERFFMPGRPPFSLDPRDPILYFLQRLRDEAHRFAIGTHRARRAKAHRAFAARRYRRHRRQPQEGAVASFRLGAHGGARRPCRARAGRRHHQNRGEKDL